MTLKEYRADYYTFSGKVSDLSRQLAFAAIAIIWLFKTDTAGQLTIPHELVLPSILIVLALGLDLLQYCWATVTWYAVYRRLEKRGVSETEEITHSEWLVLPMSLIFWLKVALVAIAYCFILIFLLHTLSVR